MVTFFSSFPSFSIAMSGRLVAAAKAKGTQSANRWHKRPEPNLRHTHTQRSKEEEIERERERCMMMHE